MAPATLVARAERLQGLCLGRALTVGAGESCTGGLIAESITAVAGSSGYFLGSIVAYANEAKASLLGVPAAAIEAHGAVSAQVAKAMATGARERFGASLAVGVTGIAGPEGGTAEKPVGLVYLALATDAGVDVRRFQWSGDRNEVREHATVAALDWLIEAAS